MEEVVALEELIAELCETQTIASFTVQTFLNAILRHHVVHGDVLTDIANKVEEGITLHPIVVVDEFGTVGSVGLKVEKARELLLDATDVVRQSLLIEQIALLTLTGGVANHTRSTANKRERLMTTILQVAQHHDATQVTNMEGISRRVNTYISRYLFFCKKFFCARHHLMEHTAPFEFVYEIHRLFICFMNLRTKIRLFLGIVYVRTTGGFLSRPLLQM